MCVCNLRSKHFDRTHTLLPRLGEERFVRSQREEAMARNRMPDRDGAPDPVVPTVDPLGWPQPVGRESTFDDAGSSGTNDLGWPNRGCGSGGVTGPDGATYDGSDLF